MDKTVGIVGLGIMGGAIARNLIDREWRVIGFDIDAVRRSSLPSPVSQSPTTSANWQARRPSS
jgi:3-hydroxyisobutyrate dehydrogenase-like beta-hydroxyacid dehydrogenase